MPKLITTSELKALIGKEDLHISHDRFSEKHGSSADAFKNVLGGKTKLSTDLQRDYIDTAFTMAGPDALKKIGSELPYFMIRAEIGEWAFSIIKNWIATADISTLAAYWDNLDSTYGAIDITSTRFLYRCIEITSPADGVDKRAELLSYLQAFPVEIASVQAALPTIQIFLNADTSFKQKEVNHKKSKVYQQQNNPEVAKNYREELERRYEKMFFEEDSDRAALVYNQAGFIATMDKMDWDLLIAYTLLKQGDESGESVRQAWDKLEELISTPTEK